MAQKMAISIGVASLLCAGFAHAQGASSSSVTLWGIADAYVGQSSATNAAGQKTRATIVGSGGDKVSRWGVRGQEALGDGYSTFFNLESGFAIDTGASGNEGQLFGRTAMVGVQGPFGSIAIGRMLTVYDAVRSATDPFVHSAFSPTTVIYARDGASYYARLDNSVRYLSPEFAGMSFALTTTSPEGNGTRSYAANARYKFGMAEIVAGWQEDQSGGARTGKNSNMLIGATYDFGSVKIFGNYNRQTLKNGFRSGGNTAATATTSATAFSTATITTFTDGTDNEWHLGASYTLGQSIFLADYAVSKMDRGPQAGADRSYALQWNYNLSKRSALYAALRSDSERDGATRPKSSLFGVGVRHYF